MFLIKFFVTLLIIVPLYAQKVDKETLLDSYIPASMQIIAHVTELMKFDLKPPSASSTTSTTTVSPTRPHKPGVFAPLNPPQPPTSVKKQLTYEEYVHRITEHFDGDYFDRYYARSLGDDLDLIWGKGSANLVQVVNTIEQVEDVKDKNQHVQEFLKLFDDSGFRQYLATQPHKPPVRAYVGLLSLYDLLNKESKVLALNKYTGYSKDILAKLVELSSGTSANQLQYVLSQVSKRRDTNNQSILNRIDELVKDLGQNSSYINSALRNIPPLVFTH